MRIKDWQRCLDQHKPQVIEACCQITTPMFLGNGSQSAVDIRPPSIKGALRFWWRALQWRRFMEDSQGHEKQALQKMHKFEATLFGSSAKESTEPTTHSRHAGRGGQAQLSVSNSNYSGGQSLFNLNVHFSDPELKSTGWSPAPGIQYLLGQGCFRPGRGEDKGVSRSSLCSNQPFTVVMSSKPGNMAPDKEQWNELEQALILWSLLGGLGSRGRKGLGSVSLQSLKGGMYSAPANETEYTALLQTILTPASSLTNFPPFSALSSHSRIDLSITGTDPLALLNQVGEQLQLYRAWGHDGKIAGKQALQNFRNDHDDGLKAINGTSPSQPAKRAVFGLPHNYFYKSIGKKLEISLKPHTAHHNKTLQTNGNRRASPLFIHIHQFPDGNALVVQLLMPAQFLPSENSELSYKPQGSRTMSVKMSEELVDWSVITRYLDEHFSTGRTIIGAKSSSA